MSGFDALPAVVSKSMRRWRSRTVVVAVSGGADSVGLLRLLDAVREDWDLTLSVAHLDHGVRGEAAREDAAFVADLAASLGLPFDLGHWSPERPHHFEADARRARYDWLVEVANRREAGLVAVGHTRDDQAETILHRIVRGTGPRGLAGMLSRRRLAGGVTLLRPLLEASRDEIRLHLQTIDQGFREDATNADIGRTRARIRRDLLPRLAADYNPKVAEAIVRLGRLVREAERERGRHLARLERRAVADESEAGMSYRRSVLAAVSQSMRAELFRRAWRRRGWPEREMDAARWRRLAEIAPQVVGRTWAGPGVVLERDGEVVRLVVDRPAVELPGPTPLAVPGSVGYGDGTVVVAIDPEAPSDETIDLDRLSLPLAVGPIVLGERFDPLGLGGHSQTLNDFLRGCRVPPRDRPRGVVVRDRAGVVWVVGRRIADRVKVTAATTRTVGLRWEDRLAIDRGGPSA